MGSAGGGLENVDATRGHVDVLWQSAAGYDACGRCAASHASRSSTDLRSRVQMRLKSADAKEGVGLIGAPRLSIERERVARFDALLFSLSHRCPLVLTGDGCEPIGFAVGSHTRLSGKA